MPLFHFQSGLEQIFFLFLNTIFFILNVLIYQQSRVNIKNPPPPPEFFFFASICFLPEDIILKMHSQAK